MSNWVGLDGAPQKMIVMLMHARHDLTSLCMKYDLNSKGKRRANYFILYGWEK